MSSEVIIIIILHLRFSWLSLEGISSYAVKQIFFKTSYYSSNKQKTYLQMSDVSVNRPSSAVH